MILPKESGHKKGKWQIHNGETAIREDKSP